MRKTVNLLFFCIAAATLLSSCVSKKKFTELMDDKEAIANQLAEAQKNVKSLEETKAQLEEDNSNLTSEVSQLNTDLQTANSNLASTKAQAAKDKAKMEGELNTLNAAIKGVFASYEGSGLNVEERDNRLYVVMDNPINFKMGSSYIARSYRDPLASLAEILKNNPSLSIQVEGHSDNAKFFEGKGDNWNLSLSRAMNAVRLLLKNGVSPNQLSAVGRGEYAPVAKDDQSSNDARAKNRRVEFVVVPNIESVYNVKP
jgi:chemotaxis protein MotB